MGILDFTWYYVVVFLVLLTILVFVHELGHYWVARRNNVRVEVFSVGFGPELYGWTDSRETRWKISAIPLGGYVKMLGQEDIPEGGEEPRELTEEEKAVSFEYKTVGQRAAIVFAGPAINFIFGILVFALLAAAVGTPHTLASIDKVRTGSAAEVAGFQSGDRVISIDGKPITYFDELREIVSKSPGTELTFVVVRNESEITLRAVPTSSTRTGEDGVATGVGLLGVEGNREAVEYKRQNPAAALWFGIERTYTLTIAILKYVGDMLVGNRGTDDLGGPLRIAQVAGQMAQEGMIEYVHLMALLSVNLGLINLFPIPMLDGGHLVFFGIEALRGRPLGPRAQEYGFRFGLILVLMLVVFVTWNDLVHLEVIEFIKGLIT